MPSPLPATLAMALLPCLALAQAGDPNDPAKAFFARGEVVRIEVGLAPASRSALRERPREYAAATVRIDGTELPGAVVKLKGSAGSFQNLDERPGLTVHFGKNGGTSRFHGLVRFHLNNGAQDDSRLHEWLGGEIFTAAGYPAPRVAHALVTLDGRPLGLYVLREAFDSRFLQRVFGTTAGNLYDGGFCQDLDSDLEKDSGDGVDDRADLLRLREICRGFDASRTTRIEQALDVAALLDFCALEAMVGHWDGYSLNRNNYRLWLTAAPGQSRFLPHGMDQLFGDSEASILRHPPALAASAVMQVPAWRKKYRERLTKLLPLFAPSRLQPKLKALGGKLRRELAGFDADAANAYEGTLANLLERVEARYRNLQEQVKAPEPKPQQFPGNRPLALKVFHPAAETDHLELKKQGFQGVTAWSIACTARGEEPRQGAFRTSLLLGRGRYRLRAMARCENVEAPPPGDDGQPTGGLRLAVLDARSKRLFGDANWQPLECEFTVAEFQQDVELRLDLRARGGRGWFRCDSVQLEKLPD